MAHHITTLGRTLGAHRPRLFGIKQPDRLLHFYVIGQTGTGKSTLLLNMARQDAAAGRGFCFIDPHGDLAGELVSSANQEVIYWNAADPASPYGYNPLSYVSKEYRPLVASGLIDTLKQQWVDAWGPRMEHLLRYALLALLELKNASIADIMPLFLYDSFREHVIRHLSDETVRKFWQHEYLALRYKNSSDGVTPIANKLGGFLAHPLVRQATTAPVHPLRFRTLMDEGQNLVVNLAKGKLGADIANLLGGLIVTSLAHAAYTRQDEPEHQRRPFFLYVDEFHSFTTSAFAGMLSELRKYGLGLILAHQYTDQLDRSVLEAILGNVGSLFVFRVGATDAHILSRQLGDLPPRDLVSLANYEGFVKLMINGAQTTVFSAGTIRPGQTVTN